MPRYTVFKEVLYHISIEAPTQEEAIQLVDEDNMDISTTDWWAEEDEDA